MHELSIAESLLEIVRDEMQKHGARRLLSLRVRYGALSNIVPEALDFAFAALTAQSEFQGTRLDLALDPLLLICGGCAKKFTPEDSSVYAICPGCGYEFLHQVAGGDKIYLECMEAE